MSVRENPEAATILKEIENLYLNNDFSDVTFIVSGEKLPAHRTILGQRCPVFKAMFLNEPNEIKTVDLSETPLGAFKVFLKFIYTGDVEFNAVEVNLVLETFHIAKIFEMTTLEKFCIDYLKTVCNIDNVTDLVNATFEKSGELAEFCLDYISLHYAKFAEHKTFAKLPVECLEWLLGDWNLEASPEIVFKSFVDWMKANPSESAHFPKLLKNIKLNTIALDDLVTAVRPLNFIEDKDLLDIVYEQAETAEPKPIKLPNCNVLSHQYGAKVLSGGIPTFFTMPDEDEVLAQRSDSKEIITVDLGCLFELNSLVMELANGDCGYWVEVSEDNVNWTRVIDYSKHVCRFVQHLYFEERPVRYIRIGGAFQTDDMFEISRLEAYYSEDPLDFDPETGIVIPTDNVALPEKDAIILQGYNRGSRHGMIDNAKSDGTHTHEVGKNGIIVQLAQPYLLDSIRLSFNELRFCSYYIDVSTDKKSWTRVESKIGASGWQLIEFKKQPVVFVKLAGDYDSEHRYFACYHFECPAKLQI